MTDRLLRSLSSPSLPRPPFGPARALSVAITAISLVGLCPPTAQAACDPDTPPLADGGSVTCTGTDSTGFDASGFVDLTVQTDGDTTLDNTGLGSALILSDGNTVTLGDPAADPVPNVLVNVTGASGIGIEGGNKNTITSHGTIQVDSAGGAGIDVGNDNTVTLGADSIVNVDGDNAFGVRANDRNSVANNGEITVDGDGSVALSVNDVVEDAGVTDPNENPSLVNNGTITLNGSDTVALQSNDTYDLTNGLGATIQINASATNGVGILGRDNNIVNNFGTINVDAVNGRAISIGDNTTGVLPNGAIGRSGSEINLNADGTIAFDVAGGAGVSNEGDINATGDDAVAISVGNRIDNRIGANVTHQTGTIDLDGDNSFGIRAGDGWIDGAFDDTDNNPLTPDEFVPSGGGIRNLSGGTINVRGADSFGIFAGDESNTNGDHDSFIVNSGTIAVTGTDSVGVSLGGNSFLGILDLDASTGNDLFSFINGDSGQAGSITGDSNAGPLIEFRDFVAGQENRVSNPANAEILADGGVAIQGTNGDELIINEGDIRGTVDLMNGDNRYLQTSASTLDGQLIGGTGMDTASLFLLSPGDLPVFDVSQLQNFDLLELRGSGFWQLENAGGYTGITEVFAGTSLDVPEALSLGGDLLIDPDGGLRVTLADESTTPLTVAGDATFGGTLTVIRAPAVSTPGSYRVIQVDGVRTDVFATENLPTSAGLFTFETSYDDDGLILTLDVGNFSSVAQSTTQLAIAQHLDAIFLDGTGDVTLNAQISELAGSDANLATVYDALSPEAYDAQTSMLVESGRRVTNLLFDRPRACDPRKLDPWRAETDPVPCNARTWSPWLAGIGSFRSRDGFVGRPEYKAELGGAAVGVDFRPTDALNLTVALATQRGSIDVTSFGKSTLTMTDLSAHAAYAYGPLRAQTAFSWGHAFHESKRNVHINGTTVPVSATAEDDFESDRFTLAAEVGLLFSVGPIDIEPIAGIDWNWIEQDDVRESGGGAFGLALESRDDEVGSVNGGIRLSSVYHHTKYLAQQLNWMDGVWRPTLDLRWRQMLTGYDRELNARLVGAGDTVSGFSIDGKEDKGGFEVGAGVSFVPSAANRLQFDFRYEAYRASHTVDHELTGRITLGF